MNPLNPKLLVILKNMEMSLRHHLGALEIIDEELTNDDKSVQREIYHRLVNVIDGCVNHENIKRFNEQRFH